MVKERFPEFEVLVENIRNFKEQNKLTYEKIGNATGVNKSHIYRVIKMDVYPSLPFLIQLSRYMGVPLSELFTPPQNRVTCTEEEEPTNGD